MIGGVEFNPPTTGYTVAGPATIYARSGGNGTSPAFVTVSITRANSTPTSAPLNTVVIPSDATGSYNVVLESSTDLITWVAANPATYSGITTNRFFRVRVIKQ